MSAKRPNIIFIMSDDHAAHAMSCYGSRINRTPHLDRIADGGVRLDNCFCTNSICTPSRASILTGTHSHVNGVRTLNDHFDNQSWTFVKALRDSGYQTAIFGKWHLGTGPEHCPTGFDDWAVLPGQGFYHCPNFFFKGPDGGERRMVKGYVTDVITDMSLDWMRNRDSDQPFCLLCHHKAPHRSWESDEKHAHMFLNEDVPEPDTLHDDYANRSSAAAAAKMRVGVHMKPYDVKRQIPNGLSESELREWAYQWYIKDYLRVVASVDDNVGRILDYLDEAGLADDTMIVYTSDQGFFLGDHGWYDKRFMYEESLRMPFVARYPREIRPGSVNDDVVTNVDFAPMFLDLAGLEVPDDVQGRSFRPSLQGETPSDWRQSMYYRYWMYNDKGHYTYAHYGLRTKTRKLIYYYARAKEDPAARSNLDLELDETYEPEWELFDLEKDPHEMNSVYDDPGYADEIVELKRELEDLQAELGDEPYTK